MSTPASAARVANVCLRSYNLKGGVKPSFLDNHRFILFISIKDHILAVILWKGKGW
jgi:hypothetical protein